MTLNVYGLSGSGYPGIKTGGDYPDPAQACQAVLFVLDTRMTFVSLPVVADARLFVIFPVHTEALQDKRLDKRAQPVCESLWDQFTLRCKCVPNVPK